VTTLNYVTITGTFTDGSDQPVDGFVTFTPSQAVYSAGALVVTPDLPVTAEIAGGALKAASGSPFELLATDNAGLSIEGRSGFWFWSVAVSLGGEVIDSWQFFLPWSTYGGSPYDGTVDLYQLAGTPA
jgi:hypothetical protein